MNTIPVEIDVQVPGLKDHNKRRAQMFRTQIERRLREWVPAKVTLLEHGNAISIKFQATPRQTGSVKHFAVRVLEELDEMIKTNRLKRDRPTRRPGRPRKR